MNESGWEDALQEIGEVKLLAVQVGTLFELTESGRLRHENSPDRSPAPRMWMGGSAAGNIARVRVDVGDETARAIADLVVTEPPLRGLDGVAVHIDEYETLLSAEAPVKEIEHGMTYAFPRSFRYEHGAIIVSSETPEGAALLASLQADGMPEDLAELGFTDTSHFWPPWCVALDDGAIVSIAFTARLSPAGAEVGVVTIPASRRRGFAAATTAEWGLLPWLAGRDLFYSTTAENVASQHVADRLGLRVLGPSLSIL